MLVSLFYHEDVLCLKCRFMCRGSFLLLVLCSFFCYLFLFLVLSVFLCFFRSCVIGSSCLCSFVSFFFAFFLFVYVFFPFCFCCPFFVCFLTSFLAYVCILVYPNFMIYVCPLLLFPQYMFSLFVILCWNMLKPFFFQGHFFLGDSSLLASGLLPFCFCFSAFLLCCFASLLFRQSLQVLQNRLCKRA